MLIGNEEFNNTIDQFKDKCSDDCRKICRYYVIRYLSVMSIVNQSKYISTTRR